MSREDSTDPAEDESPVIPADDAAGALLSACREREAELTAERDRLNHWVQFYNERFPALVAERDRLNHWVQFYGDRFPALTAERDQLNHQVQLYADRYPALVEERDRLHHRVQFYDERVPEMVAERDRLQHQVRFYDEHYPALVAERDRLNHLAEHHRAREGALIHDLDVLRHELHHRAELERSAPQRFPPGHFYSPIPPLSEVERYLAKVAASPIPSRLDGIALRGGKQLELLRSFREYYETMRFPVTRSSERRFWFENEAYSYSDGFFLHAMIRHVRPKRIIEVGSGYSSAMILDTNELHAGNAIECTFIEPYPELLTSLLRPQDTERIEVLGTRVQDVPLETFDVLRRDDILFVDSTHVVRAGGDVNHILFSVLPRLAPGVLIHFHDVFYPFEYPSSWLREGRQWHELYLLRAFLTHNRAYEIVAMNHFLQTFHRQEIARDFPLLLKNAGGSLWLRKLG